MLHFGVCFLVFLFQNVVFYLGRGVTWVVGLRTSPCGGTWVHVAVEMDLPVFLVVPRYMLRLKRTWVLSALSPDWFGVWWW